MSRTRVYVPSSFAGLRALVTADGIGPAPFLAHAVTDELRRAFPEGGDEELEYAAAAAASRTSLGLLGEGDARRRVVVAADVETVTRIPDDDPTVVEVGEVVPFRRIAALLVDTADAEDDVTAAARVWAAAEAGDAGAEEVVQRCLDHELGWYASQEIGDLL